MSRKEEDPWEEKYRLLEKEEKCRLLEKTMDKLLQEKEEQVENLQTSFTYELAKYSIFFFSRHEAVISTLRGVRDIAAFFASEASSVSDSYI